MSLIMEAIKKAQQMRHGENQKNSWSEVGLREVIPLKEHKKKWLLWSVLILAGGLSVLLIWTNPLFFFSSALYHNLETKVQVDKIPKTGMQPQAAPEEKKSLKAGLKEEKSPPSSPSLAKIREIETSLLPLTLVAIQEPARQKESSGEKENFKEEAKEDDNLKDRRTEIRATAERKEEQKDIADMLAKKEEEKPSFPLRAEVPAPEIKVEKVPEKSTLVQEAVRHFNAGIHFYRQRDLWQAIQSYKKAIQLDPQLLEAYNNLALAYQEIGHLDLARETLQIATQINPNYEKAWNNLGIILLLQNRYQEAKEVFQKSLLLNPQHVETHLNLGVLYRKEGALPKALESYQKALQISPLRGEIHYNLALIWEEMNNLPEAIRHYRSFLHLSAKDYPGLAAEVSHHLKRLGKNNDQNKTKAPAHSIMTRP